MSRIYTNFRNHEIVKYTKKDCVCKGLHVDFPPATPCGQQLIAARWRFQRPTITARPLRTACKSTACGVSTGEHGHARYIARAHFRALLACAYLYKDLERCVQRTACIFNARTLILQIRCQSLRSLPRLARPIDSMPSLRTTSYCGLSLFNSAL